MKNNNVYPLAYSIAEFLCMTSGEGQWHVLPEKAGYESCTRATLQLGDPYRFEDLPENWISEEDYLKIRQDFGAHFVKARLDEQVAGQALRDSERRVQQINLHLYSHNNKTRLSIGGHNPYNHRFYNKEEAEYRCDSITVDPGRGAKVIARDISRRFLPRYRKRYFALLDKEREHLGYDLQRRETGTKLCEIFDADTFFGLANWEIDLGCSRDKSNYRVSSAGNNERRHGDLRFNAESGGFRLNVEGIPIELADPLAAVLGYQDQQSQDIHRQAWELYRLVVEAHNLLTHIHPDPDGSEWVAEADAMIEQIQALAR